MRITRVSGILIPVFDIVHAGDKLLLRNTEGIAELHRIESATLLVHDHHDIVGMLVIYQQLTRPIGDHATRGILYLLGKGITVGILLIVITKNLKGKQTNQVDDYD